MKKIFRKSVERMSDLEIIIQALRNTENSRLAEEIYRLVNIRKIQARETEEKRQREFRLHREKTGEAHPDDDIPF